MENFTTMQKDMLQVLVMNRIVELRKDRNELQAKSNTIPLDYDEIKYLGIVHDEITEFSSILLKIK